jgi:hypothetical protein
MFRGHGLVLAVPLTGAAKAATSEAARNHIHQGQDQNDQRNHSEAPVGA